MKILALADQESKALWDYFDKSKLKGIDLIISCGDLAPQYLSFLATFTHAPVLYVHGNHDDCYAQTPPDGCICIEDTIYTHEGIRIMGLGGSMRYKNGTHQYTQAEMNWRAARLWPKIAIHRGFDILVAHSPAFGFHDGTDLPHTGFTAFNKLMDRYRPDYFIHGHVHATYGSMFRREDLYGGTRVINAYERHTIDYEK